MDMLLFSVEKTEFPFFVIPYFWGIADQQHTGRKTDSKRVSRTDITFLNVKVGFHCSCSFALEKSG